MGFTARKKSSILEVIFKDASGERAGIYIGVFPKGMILSTLEEALCKVMRKDMFRYQNLV